MASPIWSGDRLKIILMKAKSMNNNLITIRRRGIMRNESDNTN